MCGARRSSYLSYQSHFRASLLEITIAMIADFLGSSLLLSSPLSSLSSPSSESTSNVYGYNLLVSAHYTHTRTPAPFTFTRRRVPLFLLLLCLCLCLCFLLGSLHSRARLPGKCTARSTARELSAVQRAYLRSARLPSALLPFLIRLIVIRVRVERRGVPLPLHLQLHTAVQYILVCMNCSRSARRHLSTPTLLLHRGFHRGSRSDV